MPVLGAVAELAALMATVALLLYVLAGIAAALFLLRGSMLVYALLAGEKVATPNMWVRAKLESVAMTDGIWAVACGIGSVVIVGGWLIAVTQLGRQGHYLGVGMAGFAAWTLGTMRRTRQMSRPEQ